MVTVSELSDLSSSLGNSTYVLGTDMIKWMDGYCVRAVRSKFKSWKQYLRTRNRYDYERYCANRNRATKATIKAKKKFEKSIADSVKDNPKSFWGYVRSKTKARSGVSDLKNENGDLVYSDEDKANILNDFFASVFIRENTRDIPDFDKRYNGMPVTEINVTKDKVLKDLKSLNVSKSMGPDGCHPRILKETAEIIHEPLYEIFKKSFEEGEIPKIWKDANVSSIYKNKGSKSSATNYRPVSLTCVPCRLSEKCVRDTILTHMNSNKLFSDCQFGFREKRSCVLQLLDVFDDWVKAYDEGFQIDTIYLDFKKAFDSVPHRRLLVKLKEYGFDGTLLKWIEDFLKDRRQRVVLNGNYSEWKDVTSGIPQGSVLGPVLFIIYINDMPETIRSLCRLFADDSKIYRRVKTNEDQQIIQSDLLKLCDWSDKWLLDFSVPKCKVVQYGTNIIEFIYKMRDSNTGLLKNLPCEDEEKDLGIKFSNTLKFDSHISMAVNKANQIVGLIKRSFNYMDKAMFLKLYKSIVRPHLDYGDAVWYAALKKNKRLVENVQRRATRIVPELQGLSYEEILRELNLPTLDYRRKRGDLIHLFKMIHGYHEIDSKKFFSFSENTTRGHMYKISKPRCLKSLRLNAFPAR